MTLLAIALYGVGTLVFIIFGVIIIYHLKQYGFIGDATKFMIVVYILVTVLIVVSSGLFIARTDWGKLSFGAFGELGPTTPTNSQTPIFGGDK